MGTVKSGGGGPGLERGAMALPSLPQESKDSPQARQLAVLPMGTAPCPPTALCCLRAHPEQDLSPWAGLHRFRIVGQTNRKGNQSLGLSPTSLMPISQHPRDSPLCLWENGGYMLFGEGCCRTRGSHRVAGSACFSIEGSGQFSSSQSSYWCRTRERKEKGFPSCWCFDYTRSRLVWKL